MPKIARELTDLQVRRIDQPGWHAVGGVAGLLLQVRKPGGANTKLARSWVLRIQNGLKRVPLGLGSYPQFTLKEARERARRLVLEARDGVDLLESKRARRQALLDAQARSKTFIDVAAEYIEAAGLAGILFGQATRGDPLSPIYPCNTSRVVSIGTCVRRPGFLSEELP